MSTENQVAIDPRYDASDGRGPFAKATLVGVRLAVLGTVLLCVALPFAGLACRTSGLMQAMAVAAGTCSVLNLGLRFALGWNDRAAG